METPNKRVLIVDDDPLIVKLYKRLFEISNFDAFSASTGEEAKKILKENTFDMAVLDFQLPDMEGFEIADFIRKDNNMKDMKLVIFSGFADRPEIIKKCEELGITCILKGKEPPADLILKAISLLNE